MAGFVREPPRFGGGAPSELRAADAAESPEWLAGMLDRIVLKALQLDPGKRFSSAVEMRAVLEGVEVAVAGGGPAPVMGTVDEKQWEAGMEDGSSFSQSGEAGRARPGPAAAVILRRRLPRWLKICAGVAVTSLLAVAAGIWWTKRWTDRWEKSLEQDQVALALPGAERLQPGRVAVPLPPPPAGSPPPVALENSLGMKFRPFPRSEALLCIWETRIRDYKVHAAATPTAGEPEWMKETGFTYEGMEALVSLGPDGWKKYGATWRKPGWEIEDDLPVAGPCWLDAAGFCTWLTWEERRSGRIRQDQAYRLPTDGEWSAAAGLPAEPGATAEEREASWPPPVHFWIWGPTWPPPEGVVNAAGTELRQEGMLAEEWDTLPFADPWTRVAPVEALPASALGFFHLCGNVEEWTESPGSGEGGKHYVLRGSSWSRGNPRSLTLNKRTQDRGVVRMDYRGFRVVFQPSWAEGWRYAGDAWRGKTQSGVK